MYDIPGVLLRLKHIHTVYSRSDSQIQYEALFHWHLVRISAGIWDISVSMTARIQTGAEGNWRSVAGRDA
jgi:hypothetical protein